MRKSKPVAVSQAAFVFCKSAIAVILWLAFIFKVKWLVIVSFVILSLSAFLGLSKAPLIVLYTSTIDRIVKSHDEVLDEYSIRFAQGLGALFNLVCLFLLYLVNERMGWAMVFIAAILKTSGALGFCTAIKLYECMFNRCPCNKK